MALILYSILKEGQDVSTVGQDVVGIGKFKLKVSVKSTGPEISISLEVSDSDFGPKSSFLHGKNSEILFQ